MTLKNHRLTAMAPASGDPLEGLDDKALLALRARIDLQLKTDLSLINLSEELGLTYRSGKALLESIQGGDTPPNQKAQVFNTVSRMLADIVKQQKIVYSAERLKRFEAAFVKILNKLPEENRRIFFDLYGDFLAEDSEAARGIGA